MATGKVIDCMPYFPGSGGENENKSRLLPETNLQPGHRQTVFIILGHRQQEQVQTILPAQCVWCNLNRHISVCVQKPLSWSQWAIPCLEGEELEGREETELAANDNRAK